jgi:hypothetical protein
MATFKAMNVAAQLASDLSLRLQGQGGSGLNVTTGAGGTNITAIASTFTYGTASVVQACVLIGTQMAGAHSNSASLLILPEQLNLTTGVASNVWNNSIGIAQEVYTPHQLVIGVEAFTTIDPWDNEAARLVMQGVATATGMRVTLVKTTNGTAPTPANVMATLASGPLNTGGTNFALSFVTDQYNPLTNQS